MQPKVDDSRKAKRALTLAQDIVRDIEAGAHVAGDRLAREDEMLARYDVARATLREALRFLELQGVIHLQLGRCGGQIGRAPSELQSLMRLSYAVFCLTKKQKTRMKYLNENNPL